MNELEDYEESFEDDHPRVFKLVTGEEIVTTVVRTDDMYFIIEVPLEIRYNSIKGSMFLTKWIIGGDYTRVMTLSGTSVVSVSTPEDFVTENYNEYRRRLIEGLMEEQESESKEQLYTNIDEDTPTFH